jgi:phosphotransferase system  glucose/maltose/N-acetylglucosamine-specific IIC component
MFTNYNIVKYCAKYLLILIAVAYIFSFGSLMANARNDFMNLISTLVFAGLLVGLLLILKSDLIKLITNIKNTKKEENE